MQKINLIITREQGLELNLQNCFSQISLPLTKAIPTNPSKVNLDDFTGVIFTSMNGVKYFSSLYDGYDFTKLKAYCVGAKTAEQASQLGFSDVSFPKESNATSLCNAIEQTPTESRLLYARAENVSIDITKTVKQHSIIEQILYKNAPVNLDLATWKNALEKCSAICFFSQINANYFSDFIIKNNLSTLLNGKVAFCLSTKIGNELKEHNFADIVSSNISDAAHLSETIEKYYNKLAND